MRNQYECGDFRALSTIMLLISRRRASYYYIITMRLILSWLRLSVGLFHLQVADGCFIIFLLDGLVLVGVV
ncbi:hypothetical protein EB796_011971 [Bugula neritina]|uniref:Uncharacterized protein n=1 Tax=Bugula neritina TaxID=10212 RepID=A0A7J7JVH5_BUGNE|nr:hypothetical protein EB796_011971 [Bugula neritina]